MLLKIRKNLEIYIFKREYCLISSHVTCLGHFELKTGSSIIQTNVWRLALQARASVRCVPKKLFSYFSIKTYVVGTQKNRLNETVLLSTQNIC